MDDSMTLNDISQKIDHFLSKTGEIEESLKHLEQKSNSENLHKSENQYSQEKHQMKIHRPVAKAEYKIQNKEDDMNFQKHASLQAILDTLICLQFDVNQLCRNQDQMEKQVASIKRLVV